VSRSKPAGKTRQKTRSDETESAERNYAKEATEYAKAVVAGKIVACKWVKLACMRHLKDLRRKGPDWPYKFDEWHANDVCDFAEKMPHVEGAWETDTIRLEAPQVFILAVVFGWRRISDGKRRFTSVYIEMARKGAKSTLTAVVSLYCLCCEDEPGPQIIIGATTGEQAWKVFKPAKLMVEKLAQLREHFGIKAWARSITCQINGGFIQTINAKGKTQDGWNPHLGVLDELHAHDKRDLFDVVKSAFGARKNPLMWCITTAGVNIAGVCYEQRTYITKVLESILVAEHYFGIIFTLDEGDDPYEEKNWPKANPLMPLTPSLEWLRSEATDAKASPASAANFKTKNLNIWLSGASQWLNMEQWKRCAADITWESFDGLDCWIGGDLADKDDITALVLAAFEKSGRMIWKPVFWLPEATLLTGAIGFHADQQAQYRSWAAKGFINLTEGDWIDHAVVEAQAREWIERFSVRGFTVDQFAAGASMAAKLNEDFGHPDNPFAQILHKTAKNVTDPAKELEKRVKAGPEYFAHDGNEVLTWMASNTCVTRKVDETLIPKKETPMSANKIDGIDAGINAIAPAVIGQKPEVDLSGFLANPVIV
jgi:phage terminase large subunit-like protein